MKLSGLSNSSLIIAIVAIVLFVILLTIFIILQVKKKKSKTSKIKVDNELISTLITLLGGENNVKTYSSEGSRVKFELESLDNVKLDELKEISTGGVFVTGNNVKIPFAYSSEEVIKMLNKVLK